MAALSIAARAAHDAMPQRINAMAPSMRVLVLPGWQDSGPEHWQSRWERDHGFARVQQDDWLTPRRGDWLARLDEALLAESQPVRLAAHSLGCQLVAAWAAHSRHTARVAGALLVAPPDTEREDTPGAIAGAWRRIERGRLPFAATVVASTDDPFCTVERARGMAADWGASFVDVGPRGHVNAASGLGDWPEGLALLHALGPA
jgi:predicted alpha/beta hydrolase family esterase